MGRPYRSVISIAALLLGAAWLGAAPAPTPEAAQPGHNTPWVKVDTVGYPLGWQKLAILNALPDAVDLVDAGSGQAVSRVALDGFALRKNGHDDASQDNCWQLDFSGVTLTGRFRLRAVYDAFGPDDPSILSDPFSLEAEPFARVRAAALKSFYYQRAHCALEQPYTDWEIRGDSDYRRRSADHLHAGVGWLSDDYPVMAQHHPTERGWFHGGDYGMFAAITAPSAQLLMYAYELAPQAFGDDSGIPESGNRIPDILDEACWGLDWLASLQDWSGAFRSSEAAFRRDDVWDGPADRDLSVRWLALPGTASAAKCVAALAQGSRLLRGFDAARSKRYANAADKGWQWLRRQGGRVLPDLKGSDQPLWDDGPGYLEDGARADAAMELWRAFRYPEAEAILRAYWGSEQLSERQLEGGWANVGRFAVWGAILDQGPEAREDLAFQARRRVVGAVERYRDGADRDGYRCLLAREDYARGSAARLLERASLLALAARVDAPSAWALPLARDQWHWVLGRNPNAYSLVTRVGKGPTRIFHAEWGRKRSPPPGFLINGPNYQDAAFLSPGAPAKALLWFSLQDLSSGVLAGDPFHNDVRDLWEGGLPAGSADERFWSALTEAPLYGNADLVLAAALLTE